MGNINLSALSQITTAAQSLGNLILVNPRVDKGIQAQLVAGSTQPTPPKFLFNYYGENTVTLDSDITDHYVEDNTALQDQISLKPILITGHGYVGELNDIAPEGVLQAIRTVAEKLTTVSAYVPQLSVTANLVYAQAFQAYQVAQLAKAAAVSAWTGNVFRGSDADPLAQAQNKQQQAFLFFKGYWEQRTLFTVQTPWAIFPNCAIKTVRAIQDADTDTVTSFEVVFKVINFASTQVLQKSTNAQGQLVNQIQAGQSPIDGGTYSPPSSSVSIASQNYWSTQLGGA